VDFKYLLLTAALVGAAVITDFAAYRDEVAARRFRELNTEVVQGDLDKSRNKRWHRLGAIQRGISAVLLAAFLGALVQSWLVAVLAGVISVTVTLLLFDIDFNRRLGKPWDYVGTTSSIDAGQSNGRRMSAIELGVLLLGVLAWLLFV
jgi:hypothetical protein